MTRPVEPPSTRWRYLLRESFLILLLAYVLLFGGSYSGLVLAPLRLVNTVLLGLLGAVWLALRLLRRRPFPRTPLDLPLLAYLVVFAVTAAFSIDPRRSAGAVWRLGLYVLLFYAFVDLLRHGWPAELFVKVALVIGAIVLAFALWHLVRWYRAWHAIWGWARLLPPLTVRVRSFIGHSNWLAAFVNLLWPLALFRLVASKKWPSRFFLVAWLVAAAVVLYFTSSRGAWLGTIAAIATIVLLALDLARLKRWVLARHWRLVVGILAASVVTLVLAVLVGRQMRHPTHGGVLDSRLHFWRTAWTAFRVSPILGTGPFTYGETYLSTHSVPPHTLYGVAHSYPINLAAESGLLGLAALAWLTLTLVWSIWRGWRRSSSAAGHLHLGALAALVTAVVHGQFDSVATVPYLSVLLALLLALLLKDQEPGPIAPVLSALLPAGAAERKGGTSPHRTPIDVPQIPESSRRRAAAWILPLGWALLLVAALWSLRASLVFSAGTAAANAGDWSTAARRLDQAVRWDPHHAYYHLEAGHARGVLAQNQPDHLDVAIAHYQAAIARSPNYALNAANLGALLWQAGETDRALAWMERAVEQAPRSVLFHLNLARLYEELGQEKSARRHYEIVLDRASNWADATFWRATPLRATAKQDWLEARPEPQPVSTPATFSQWLRAGRRALADGRHDDARRAFQRALSLNPHDPRAYVGQATAAAALGLEDEAEKLLRTALLTEGGQEPDRLRACFSLARLYHRQGRVDDAIRLAEETVARARDPYALIPGQLGSSDYAWYLFHSERIDASLLPQLAVITVTDEVADWMLKLGAWHEQDGDPAAAAAVYRQLLEEVPDHEPAHRRLDDLEP